MLDTGISLQRGVASVGVDGRSARRPENLAAARAPTAIALAIRAGAIIRLLSALSLKKGTRHGRQHSHDVAASKKDAHGGHQAGALPRFLDLECQHQVEPTGDEHRHRDATRITDGEIEIVDCEQFKLNKPDTSSPPTAH